MPKKKESYYGAFFWLTLVAFAVPIFVGVTAFQAAPRPHEKPEPDPGPSGVDQRIWDYLLKTYVSNGLIDYDGMERDYLFKEYIRELGAAKPEALPNEDARLAYLINAYNAFVVNGVLTHEVTESVMNVEVDGTGFFDLKEHILASETISLNHLEHGIIREEFQEPRIHMALVCAAMSCPAIRPEAYEGARLDKQLEDQAVQFANNPKYVRYDAENQALHLSKILQWYGQDFDDGGGYLAFLKARVEDESTRQGIDKAMAGEAEVVFNDYDWALNARGRRGGGASKKSTDFGSGSIPNE